MKKPKNIYSCSECGYQSVRWLGRCPDCGGWNTFIEEVVGVASQRLSEPSLPEKIEDIKLEDFPRIVTDIGEFNRVLGGGIVPGSLVLIAGEPGVGKSTMLLAVAGNLALKKNRVLYITAEESKSQVKLRASRLNVSSDNLYILSTTELDSVKRSLEALKPDFTIVDSVQTLYNPEVPSTPGSVTQVRENASFFLDYSKRHNVSVFLVGHITKEGVIAGPKVLEHMVDVVLYFEGEIRSDLRLLRSIKNRFGPTDEVGVFAMEASGLKEIPEASSIFLPKFYDNVPGAVIFPSQEGSRTILAEIQSLVAQAYFGIPKRSVTGLDYNRANLIIAVLEKKLNMKFNNYDVYLNTGGGLKITEPAADLAIAVTCASALKEKPPVEGCVFLGEIALTGEIRPVSHLALRLKEAARLGYKMAVIPEIKDKGLKEARIESYTARYLKDAVDFAFNHGKT